MTGGKHSPQVTRTQAETWYRRLNAAANRTQLESAWRNLQQSNARFEVRTAILCTAEGADHARVVLIAFPDNTLLVAQPRFSENSPWKAVKLRLKVPDWVSLPDPVGVFDQGMLPDMPEAIHGLLDPDTVVKQECWVELVIWWIDRFGVDRFPRGCALTRDQLTDLLDKASKRHVRLMFQTLLSDVLSSDG